MDSYLQTMVDLNADMGTMSGEYRYAEGWRRHNPIGYSCDLSWDPLTDALSDISTIDLNYAAWLNE
jgi:hypothetical protein